MEKHFRKIILKATGAAELKHEGNIQELWSGYGVIARYSLEGSARPSVVVKHVKLPKGKAHPRGWNTDLSHKRKLKSYEVETAWYKQWSSRCGDACRVPECLALEKTKDETFMVFEDLDSAGYALRKRSVTLDEVKACLSWLASFHATFLGEAPEHLWKVGTYWHFDTRPDELEALDDLPLKKAAHAIDQKLKQSPFQTFVHGDAKLANFCFSQSTPPAVAAVDFQYVGGGIGMKDVAYFIGSCFHEEECEAYESELLQSYFSFLKKALTEQKKDVSFPALEENWRELFPVAWADFHRFMKGWSPGHWKIHSYSERVCQKVVEAL